MTKTAKKSDPKLWDKVKKKVTDGDKGGKPGQWSARKAQMASSEYKKEGGGYEGGKTKDNHLQQWTDEDWGTKSGKESGKTGERYLPKAARKDLSKAEYERTTAKKRADSAGCRQFSAQPKDVAEKTAKHRETAKHRVTGKHRETGDGTGSASRAELYEQARKKDIAGRSKMSKAQLRQALAA